MTIPLSEVLNVSISRQTLVPTGPGFGTLLIVSSDGTGVIPLAERIRTYSSIEAVAADYTSVSQEYRAASIVFSQNPRPTQIKIGVRDNTAGVGQVGDEMDAIAAVDNDWYGVMLTSEARVSDSANIYAEVAAWCEARVKLFLTATNEASALTGTGLPSALNTANYNRTGAIYHADADNDTDNVYPEAAAFGQMLTVDFDGVDTVKTLKFKTPVGVPASDLTPSELQALQDNNGNAVVSIGGRSMFVEGTMGSGEFFDTMHFVDWLQAEIATRVFGKLATLPKVPYTDEGMEILVNEVRLALAQGVTNGGLAPQFDDDGNLLDAFEVTVPSVLSVSESNRAARIAPPISFTARLAGAVHFASVNGTVTI